MKNLYRQSQHPDQKIKEIITALETYALGDIKYNIYGIDDCEKKEPKPIAAFILCSCLIDQAAAFAYNQKPGDNEQAYNRFIREFLPPYYQSYNLYTQLRNLLLHGYSVGEYLSLAISNPIPGHDENTISATHLTADILYSDLVKAIQKFKDKILTNTEIRENALKKYDDAPPLIEVTHGILDYSLEQAKYLIGFYKEQVIKKTINENDGLKISNLKKVKINDTEYPYILLCVAKFHYKNIVLHLDKITQQLGLPYPTETLKSAGLYQERTHQQP